MAGLVADASAVVELLLRTESGQRVREQIADADYVAAPAHLDAEVLSALARMVRAGALDPEFVGPALTKLALAPIVRFALTELTLDAWALRENITMSDALYVVLARALEGGLLTTDGRLARATGLGVSVTFIGD